MTTMESKFKSAKKDIRKAGIKVRVNIYECCRGCVTEEKLGLASPEMPVIWTYGGQGNAIRWHSDGLPYHAEEFKGSGWGQYLKKDAEVAYVYFNHSNLTNEQKHTIVEIFHMYDFVVDYNFSDSQCIGINFAATLEAITERENAVAVEQDTAVMC
jgi:hypothetical protein